MPWMYKIKQAMLRQREKEGDKEGVIINSHKASNPFLFWYVWYELDNSIYEN